MREEISAGYRAFGVTRHRVEFVPHMAHFSFFFWSFLALSMRLFAISDIHTDYKENLEWVTAHAGREREHRGTTRRETRRRDDEDCGPVDGDDVTVLLVAGDVCDDVVQFRQVCGYTLVRL